MYSTKLKNVFILRNIGGAFKNKAHKSSVRISRCFASDVATKEQQEQHGGHMSAQIKPRTNTPFTKELFLGRFDKSMLVFPEVLNNEELEDLNAMVEPVEKFFKEDLDSRAIDIDAKIPDDVLQTLKDMGLFGQQIPIELGGLGLNATKYARIGEIIALDASLAVTLAAHQAIGLKGILISGTDAQKEKYLPKLATGENVAAFCLTEPSSGSDAASIQTKATVSDDGQTFYLSGGKIWISNGGIADVFTVFAKTETTDMMGKKEEKVTAFIVERAFGGVTNGKPEDKMGIRGSNTCAVHFDNTPVPLENVLGEVGGGFKVAMNILNSGRFGMGSGFAGGLKHIMASITEHAISRTQFNTKLKDFELIKSKFAEIAVSVYAMESMSYRTAAILDSYELPDASVEAAIVKVFSSEQAWHHMSEALQVLGGLGYMKDYPYERYLRDTRISLIFEGTNEILRMYIALTCIQYAGGELRDIVKKLKDPLNNVGFLLRNMIERQGDKLTKPRLRMKLHNEVHPMLSTSAEKLEIRVYAFKGLVERYMGMYRDSIVTEQLALKRFADIAIDVYGMTSVLARCSRSLAIGLKNADHEVKLAETFVFQACKRIDANIEALNLLRTSNGDEVMMKIAEDIFKEGGYVPQHPLTKNW